MSLVAVGLKAVKKSPTFNLEEGTEFLSLLQRL